VAIGLGLVDAAGGLERRLEKDDGELIAAEAGKTSAERHSARTG